MNKRIIFAGATATLICAAVASQPARAVDPLDPSPNCSPLDPGPCTPSYCGVFGGNPCVPYYLPPIGQDLHLTISSQDSEPPHRHDPNRRIDSVGELFAALRACWKPPMLEAAHHGMQMSVRFAFKRSGEIIAEPRVTYASHDADDDTRRAWREAIDAALACCTPMPFSKGLAGAIAGRPIAVRFVDDRQG